jgi:hypothetical protein
MEASKMIVSTLHSAASFRAPLSAGGVVGDYPESCIYDKQLWKPSLFVYRLEEGAFGVEKLSEGISRRCNKNNHGNTSSLRCHYNAPLEVVEHSITRTRKLQKNNDNNTPLDLAIADGAGQMLLALAG